MLHATLRSRVSFAVGALAILSLNHAMPALARGGPDFRHVDAQAAWVMHVDVQAAMASKMGRMMMDAMPAAQRNAIFGAAEEMGFDLTRDLRHVTLYGATMQDGPDVIITVASPAIENVLAAVQREVPDYQTTTIDGYECHTFGPACVSIRPYGGDRIVVATRSTQRLVEALQVMDGKRANLTSIESPARSIETRPGAFMITHLMRMDALPGGDTGPASIVAQKSDGASIQIGERDDKAFMSMRVVAKSDLEAQDISGFGQGLLALGRMAAEDDARLKPLLPILRAFRINVDAKVVTLEVRFDPAELPLAQWLGNVQ